jgi:hypothetical protein
LQLCAGCVGHNHDRMHALCADRRQRPLVRHVVTCTPAWHVARMLPAYCTRVARMLYAAWARGVLFAAGTPARAAR